MTPMIDVVFLLLIFFVCASSGRLKELLLPTPLAAETVENQPETGLSPNREKAWIQIELTETGKPVFQLNNRNITTLEELQQDLRVLAELKTDLPIILDSDDEVPMELLLQVYDTCQAAQFEEISFAVNRPSSGI